VRDPHDRLRPEVETLHYPVSEAAAKYGASATTDTNDGDEAYADWLVSICRCAFPGRWRPTRSRDGP
jgi:hypothetical protein